MNKQLTGISLDGYSIEELKRYCRSDDVIAERIPKVCGISINIYWYRDYYKAVRFRGSLKNIFWLHWSVVKNFCHKTGNVVYRAAS